MLSNGFETKNYEQSHVAMCRKVLVLHIAEHPCDINHNELHDENEENDCDKIEVVHALPKKQ